MGFVYVNATGDVVVANTLTETSLLGSTFSLGAGQAVVGTTLRLNLRGVLTTAGVGPALQIRVFIGSVAIMDNGSVTLPALGGVNVSWEIEVYITIKTTGGAATYQAAGALVMGGSTAVLPPAEITGVVSTGLPVDLTIANAFDVKATWGTANVNNSITQRTAVVELSAA